MSQTTNHILMIEPVCFAFNEQTAPNNYFQEKANTTAEHLQEKALREFTSMVQKLRSYHIDVITIKDTPTPATPDSIFPNNWVSFHADGKVALYPMFAENRRWERRQDILEILKGKGFVISEVVDYSAFEAENVFLEGTGSMILDRENKTAYAALSQRTDKKLFEQFCTDFGFIPVSFHANQWVENQRLPIYHTNVMMCVAKQYAVVCLSTIDNAEERKHLTETLLKHGKEIIEISEKQMHSFAGNMLQVENAEGQKFLILSKTAYSSLSEEQKARILPYNQMIPVEIPTIEKIGGGSARCMMAEIFLPKI